MSEEKQDRIINLLLRVHNNQLSLNQNIMCSMGLLVIVILLVVLHLLS